MSADGDRSARRLADAFFGSERRDRAKELLVARSVLGVFESVEIGILVVDADDLIAYANPAYLELFTLPGKFLDDERSFPELVRAWCAREGLSPEEGAAIEADVLSRRPISRISKSGDRYLRVQAMPLPSGAIIFMHLDITETERLRRKREDDARLLSTIIEAAPCLIAYLDKELRFVFANRTYAEQFKKPLEGIVGQRYEEVIGPELAAEREPLILRGLAGETIAFEGRGPSPDSPMKHVHGVYAPTRDARGEPDGLVVVLVDDTKHRDLELELEQKNRELAAANAELQRLATTDSLSGCLNRGAILAVLDEELRRAARYGKSLSIALFDLDHFKLVNDIHGHAAGDEVIRRFSAISRRSFRTSDHFGRYGGEEFLAVLPEVGAEGAMDAAERARKAMALERFAAGPGSPAGSGEFAATASAGVASWEEGMDADRLLARADAALYRAKARGRNRVEGHGRAEHRHGGERREGEREEGRERRHEP
ncbi:MAG: diguanylate cyclase [Spirochaetaceae bacterium]|nr:diguanylate cyclase [Spirochaetaceae bacterium]